MTCVAGLVQDGQVYIGGDQVASDPACMTNRRDEKVFRLGKMLIGYSSSYRLGQIVRYRLQLPEHPAGMSDMAYMVTMFVESLRSCQRDSGVLSKTNEVEVSEGNLLVAYNHALYEIQSDHQVAIPADGYAAIGSGYAVALGAFYATRGQKVPKKRLRTVLDAAEMHSLGVRGPFTILKL